MAVDKQSGTPVGSFGDPLLQANFDTPDKKKNPEYGRTLLQRIYKEQNNQTSTFYFGGRNVRWMENWQWAMGRQNMNEFTDYVSTEGNKAYSPVDMTQNRIGPQFMGVLIDSMSQHDEYPCVQAIDDGSVNEKIKRKVEALFRMREVEDIAEMQKQSGMQLEPTDAYVPNDELSAEVYFKLEDKLPKEIEFETFIQKVMDDNEYKQKSRQTKRDCIVLNCECTKVEKSSDGFIKIRKVTPANLIYNFFMSDSGQMELSYIGEVYSLKVKDLRIRWGKSDTRPNGLSEKDIFEMARTANQFNNANRFVYSWNEGYMYATDRPYDDYGVHVFDCEVQTFDSDYYVSKTDAFGKENIKPKMGIPEPTSDKAKVIKTDKLTVYRGIWAVKSDKMIYWGLPDLIIKPFMNISQSLFSYSIQIPNNDGDYVPSLFERGLSPLRKWTLADLKVKQILANMRPSGIAFDIEQMRDLDLGLGNVTSPMEILKIYNQTGNIPFSSLGVNPNKEQGVPIRELANAGSVQQLQELQVILDASKQELRELWGVPLYRDGGDVGDRTSGVLQAQQNTASNNVTDFINFADKCLWEETLYKCCLLHWDDVVLTKGRTELMDTVFQIKVLMKPTAYEKEMLEQNIRVGMQTIDPSTGKPLLTFKDAFKIRNIENMKLAELYLANTEEQNERRNQEDKAAREEANLKSQQASAKQANEDAAKIEEAKIAAERDMLDFKSTKEKEVKVLEIYGQIAAKGSPIPEVINSLMKDLYPNIQIPLQQENQAMVNSLQVPNPEQQEGQQQEQMEQPQEPMQQEQAEIPM